ncbi:RNA polymerase sigma factor SigW [Paenibacillus gansuensis]|uniref:RNA polymerase sigma factor n=1 Tax=Paenibacillus gansuensis TaxID=306542 RepID=A0ABW5P686_9BACL
MEVNAMDARLARLARNGDQSAFAELVGLYKDKIYNLGYRMLGNRQEAEDVVQETFLRVYSNLERYDEAQKFSTWIFRIGTNLCIDRLRKKKPGYSLDAELNEGEGTDMYSMLPSNDPGPEKMLLLTETQDMIHKAIEELPAKYKSAVVLKYLHDLSLQEIGDILGVPVTTVKTRVHRGREFLRKKMEAKL